ncbi:MAG: hypothetical protein GX446_00780 [Chthonomonadales bacterium]|nr:hypothetical protein [Chthonomonadales bacterium]
MIIAHRIVREAAARVAGAADEALKALGEGRVEQEPAFTDRMLGAIEHSMRDFRSKSGRVQWTAKTLTDHGRNAQERRFGADFAGVLSIDLRGFRVRKGFLAQAKLIEPRASVPQRDFERMRDQCNLMLKYTPDSYLFLYAREGIRVVPAISVVSAAHPCNPHALYARSIARFYEEHFESFIGDRRLNEATPQMLDELKREADVRAIQCLEARGE